MCNDNKSGKFTNIELNMRKKINSIDEALELFKITANDNMVYAGKGDYKKANKAHDDIDKIVEFLIMSDALELLKQFYEDENLWVRLTAACTLAPIDEYKAMIVIFSIKVMNKDPYSFAASCAISNWDNLSNPARYSELLERHNKVKK